MSKTLERFKEFLEDEVEKIRKKGDITPAELDSSQKAVCTIKMIEDMEKEQSEGMMMEGDSYGYSNRNMAYRHMPVYGSYNDRSYGDSYRSYNDGYGNGQSGRRYYHDSYDRDESYHGDSYRRGRSPVTGRYISRGDRDYYDGYSGHSIKDRMVARLEAMMDEAKTDHERQTVSEWINRLQSN